VPEPVPLPNGEHVALAVGVALGDDPNESVVVDVKLCSGAVVLGEGDCVIVAVIEGDAVCVRVGVGVAVPVGVGVAEALTVLD